MSKAAQAAYQRRYRERKANGLVFQIGTPDLAPGPVELAVEQEINGLPSAALRPGLVAIAAAMARVLDAPASTPKLRAARVLASVLETLHRGAAQGRRGSLAVVKSMTERGGA
jgi:hypothetical protein